MAGLLDSEDNLFITVSQSNRTLTSIKLFTLRNIVVQFFASEFCRILGNPVCREGFGVAYIIIDVEFHRSFLIRTQNIGCG